MISKTVTFEDYEGTEHTQTFYFNMTKDEVVRWQLDPDGGLLNHLKLIIAEKNQKIGRPRQLYIGETRRDYVDLRSR